MSQYTPQQERQFDHMLNTPEVKARYRVQRGPDGVYEIPCRGGSGSDIEAFSLNPKRLCCYSPVKYKNLPAYCRFTQANVFVFPFEKLDEIAALVGARRRRHVSEEQRKKMAERLKPFNFEKAARKEGVLA